MYFLRAVYCIRIPKLVNLYAGDFYSLLLIRIPFFRPFLSCSNKLEWDCVANTLLQLHRSLSAQSSSVTEIDCFCAL